MASKILSTGLVRPLSRVVLPSAPKKEIARPFSLGGFNYAKAIQSYPQTSMTVLPNGLRVVSENYGTPTCSVGMYIATGSRFETEDNNGVAHFLEHMAFKGTKKRSRVQLEMEVENRGAHLNAYTTREQTAYFAKCFSSDLPYAVDVLSDILQNSNLGEQEIVRERYVILKEMEDVESQMEEVIFDYLHSVAFMDTPLARTILGPVKNIQNMRRPDLVDYIKNYYRADRMVLAAVGGINHEHLVSLASQHLSELKPASEDDISVPPCKFTGAEMRLRNDEMPLVHCALAVGSCGISSPDFLPLMVASLMVGNWDKAAGSTRNTSSRLAKVMAEEELAVFFKSFYTAYSDIGLWGVYFASEDAESANQAIKEMQKEWKKICTASSEGHVERAKNMLRTTMMMQFDDTTSICDELGRQVLSLGRRVSLNQIDEQLASINLDKIHSVMQNYVYDRCPAFVSIGPNGVMEDYALIRRGMNWMLF